MEEINKIVIPALPSPDSFEIGFWHLDNACSKIPGYSCWKKCKDAKKRALAKAAEGFKDQLTKINI